MKMRADHKMRWRGCPAHGLYAWIGFDEDDPGCPHCRTAKLRKRRTDADTAPLIVHAAAGFAPPPIVQRDAVALPFFGSTW